MKLYMIVHRTWLYLYKYNCILYTFCTVYRVFRVFEVYRLHPCVKILAKWLDGFGWYLSSAKWLEIGVIPQLYIILGIWKFLADSESQAVDNYPSNLPDFEVISLCQVYHASAFRISDSSRSSEILGQGRGSHAGVKDSDSFQGLRWLVGRVVVCASTNKQKIFKDVWSQHGLRVDIRVWLDFILDEWWAWPSFYSHQRPVPRKWRWCCSLSFTCEVFGCFWLEMITHFILPWCEILVHLKAKICTVQVAQDSCGGISVPTFKNVENWEHAHVQKGTWMLSLYMHMHQKNL